jgi:hypothetical protein
MIDTAQTIDSETWRVRRFRDEDRAAILELSSLHYGDREGGRVEYVDWLNSDGPAGRPVVVVGEDRPTGRIAGFVWAIAFRVKVGTQHHRCYLGCNGLVHPDFRRSGIYSAILKLQGAATAGEGGCFIYGFPKDVAIFRLRGAGYVHVARVPLLIRPLNIRALAEGRVHWLAARLALEIAWPVAAQTVFRPRRAGTRPWGLKVAEAETFDISFDRFWDRVAPKLSVSVVRDRAFLLWRFRGASFRAYTILSARAGDELVGYAVLRDYQIEGIRCGMIADLLVEPGMRGDAAGLLLVNEATRRLNARRLALAGALMLPHTQEYRILRDAGYVEAPPRLAPQTFRLMAHPLPGSTLQDAVPPAEEWFLTMADHDAI